MSRSRLRKTLALAMFDNVTGVLSLQKVKRVLTKELLCAYGIRKNTEIRTKDFSIAIEQTKDLRRRCAEEGHYNNITHTADISDTMKTFLRTKDYPKYLRVNALFGG